ncbi:hypothetical protein [Synechococcus sp. UW140]|uniref:hypothetical protein n=1 Tax=Synechococcus sp. UW140 TaxID=368503 RepID=UPI000E0F56F3|nr:hypothetical protein [Synechococcus sp. UW140]
MSAEKEIDRLEREINQASGHGGGTDKPGSLLSGGDGQPPKKRGVRQQSGGRRGNTVLVLVSALLFLGLVLPVAKRIGQSHIDALSNAAVGAAIGLAVGFGLGRLRP